VHVQDSSSDGPGQESRRFDRANTNRDVDKNVIASAVDAIMVFDAETKRFEHVNEATANLYGYSQEEFLALSHGDITAEPEESSKGFQQLLKGELSRIPLRYHRKKDGTVFPVEISASKFTLGGRTMFCGVVRDISERLEQERELCDSRDRFQVMFECAPDACYVADLRGTFLDGNRAAEKAIGYKRDELIGRSFLKLGLLSVSQVPKATALLAKNALGKPTGPDEFLINRKDGQKVPFEIRTFPIEFEGRAAVIGIARDISERRNAEQALRRANEDLEARVAERTAELEAANKNLLVEIEQRKQVEQEARQRTAELESVFQSLPDIFFRLQTNGTILDYRCRDESDLYIDPSEFLGRRMQDVLPSDVAKLFEDSFIRLEETGTTTSVEYSLTIGGETKHFEARFESTGSAEIVAIVRNVTEQKNSQKLMRAIVEGTASKTGEEFFPSFAMALAEAFGSRYILVVEHIDQPVTRARTLAFWTGDRLGENVEYDLAGTPCAETAMGEMVYHPSGIQELFPDDTDLVDMDAQSYCGIPLFGSRGQVVGHLAILDDRPLTQDFCSIPAVRIFVARAAAEMEQKQTASTLRENEARLKTLVSSAPIVITSVDRDGNLDLFDGCALQSVGFEPGQFVGQNYFELWKDRPELTAAMRECLAGRTPLPTTIEINGRILDTRYSPLHSSAGDPAGAITVCVDVTEQRLAERAMRESEERLRLVTNAMPAYISYVDADWRYQFVNKHYEEGFNAKLEDIVGQHVRDFLGEENFSQIESFFGSALSGERVSYENKINFSRLGQRDLSVEYVPDIAADGTVRGNYVFATDITERKRQEEERQQVSIALSNAMPGISKLDSAGRYVEVNEDYASMVGYRPEDLIGNDWTPTVHPDDRPQVVAAYERMLQEGKGEAEARGVRKDGSVFYKHVLLVKVDPDDEASGHFCFMRDISERRQAEADRLEAISKFEYVAQHVPDCVWSVHIVDNGACEVAYVSPGWKRIWGYDLEDICENPELWLDTIIEEDKERVWQAFSAVCETGSPRTAIYRIRTKQGELKWIEDRMITAVKEDDRVVRVEGIARDITDTRELEEQAQRHRNELAHVSRLNTMGEMTTALAHELNQPLAAMANYAFVAERALAQEIALKAHTLPETIAKLKGQAIRAGEIVRRMRGFVQKEEPANRVACDINEVIEGVVDLVGPEARLGKINIDLHLDLNLPSVVIDNVQIQQVFVNLIRNAMDAVLERGGAIRTIWITTLSSDVGSVEVRVRDSGCGLVNSKVDQLFEPFYSTKESGLGMGLAISRSIVESHRGQLWAEPGCTEGAEFRFRLPGGITE